MKMDKVSHILRNEREEKTMQYVIHISLPCCIWKFQKDVKTKIM